MTRFLQAVRWRRAVALCAASLGLHLAAVHVVTRQMPGQGAPPRQPSTGPIVVQLLQPRVQAPSAAAPVQAGPATVRGKAAPARRPPAAPGYRVLLPPSAELIFDLRRNDAQGTSALDWRHEGGRYRLHLGATEAAGSLWQLTSEGETGEAGIVPRTMTEQRRQRAAVAVHFDVGLRQLTFSASSATVKLEHGVQDSASLLVQLAAIAAADRAQLLRGVEIQVAGGRDARNVHLVLEGQEEIDTGLGRMATWRVRRVQAPESYNAQLEIWLAPGHHWFPVQLRSTEANGTVTMQTIRRIAIKEN